MCEKYCRKNRKGWVIKLDLDKAYEQMDFLDYIMAKKGFGSRWKKWIARCSSSSHFSIIINGTPKGFFPTSHGLRQGDSFSPFLIHFGCGFVHSITLKVRKTKIFPISPIIINETPKGFFLASLGLTQGGPLSLSYLLWLRIHSVNYSQSERKKDYSQGSVLARKHSSFRPSIC